MRPLNKIFTMIGVSLIIVSVCLFIYNNYEEKLAGKKSTEILNVIKDNIDEERTSIIIKDKEKQMPVTNIDGYDYIGTITIPSLDLELPIMSEFDNTRLKISPCRYYGSIYTNDLIICGHAYKSHFRRLNDLVLGDTIIFTDVNGYSYVYEVLEIEVLNYKEISKMIDNDFDLTLYTCTNDGFNRLTIRCNMIMT